MSPPRLLFISGSQGLGHVTRDLAMARALRRTLSGIEIRWLAAAPASDVLRDAGELLLPQARDWSDETMIGAEMASQDAGRGRPFRLNVLSWFWAIRQRHSQNVDIFRDVIATDPFDLIIGDEAYEIILAIRTRKIRVPVPFVMIYDFIGVDPMTRNPLEHIGAYVLNRRWAYGYRRTPDAPVTVCFIGEAEDVPDRPFGPGLPNRRRWAEERCRILGYVLPFDLASCQDKLAMRRKLGYGEDPLVVCAVGGSGIGRELLELCVECYPLAKQTIPNLHMVLVGGPRLPLPEAGGTSGLEIRGYVPALYEHFAASDVVVTQGGGTSTLELTALRRPFLYFPLEGHFEQQLHVAKRLERHGAGVRVRFATTSARDLAGMIVAQIGKDVTYQAIPVEGAQRLADAAKALLDRKRGCGAGGPVLQSPLAPIPHGSPSASPRERPATSPPLTLQVGGFTMKSSLLWLLLPVLLLSASVVAADQTTEIRSALNGDLEVRTVTSAADLPFGAAPETLPPPTENRGGEILWYDMNHQNAVAENVAVSGYGSRAIAGWWLNHKRIAFYEIEQGNVPAWTSPMVAGFQIPVDMSFGGAYTTATGRGDPIYVFEPSGPPALYSDGYTAPLVGYDCSISETGNTYIAAGGNPAGGAGEVRVYDGSGALRFVRDLPAPPEGAMVSPDGGVVAANVRTFVKVWSATTGVLRDSIPISGETQTGAVLSYDGAYLVTGGFSRTVSLYQWNESEYALLWSYLIPGTTWITALAISSDGSTLAAGTWTNPTGGKVVVFSTSSSTPLWTDVSFGDEVASVALSADGSVIVAGSWGRSGASVGNIISVYDRASATPVFGVADDAFAGIGSCMSVDVGEDGGFVFAGGKAVHAREFGNGGWTMAIRLADPTAVEEATSLSTSAFSAWPNPFRGQVTLDFAGSDLPGRQQVLVVNPDGRLVSRLTLGSGRGTAVWNGCDEGGRPLPAGVYLLKSLGAPSERACALRIIKTK